MGHIYFVADANNTPTRNDIAKLDAELARAVAAAETCMRCAGAGYFNAYRHIDGGRCFGCGGSGRSRRSAERIKRCAARCNAARDAARKAA